jgi:superoxide dismutase
MITSTLHRFNLKEASSYVNKEVNVCNRKLQKIVKMFDHKEVINMSSNRKHFTKHELYMNGMGKEWFKNRIADAINKIFTYQTPFLLALPGRKIFGEKSTRERRRQIK